MPLRTDRRAAVYRRVWGWPLRSPGHLIAAVAAATVLALGVGQAAALLRGPTPAPGPAPHPATPARPAPAPPAPTVPEQALAAAAAFGQRWTHHEGLPGPAFVAGLQPVVMPEYLVQLSTVDPARIPDTEVTGPPQPVGTAGPGTAEIDLPTNVQVLHLAMVDTGTGWRLDHLRQEG